MQAVGRELVEAQEALAAANAEIAAARAAAVREAAVRERTSPPWPELSSHPDPKPWP